MMPSPASTSMYLVYVDESYDETHYVYSALFVSAIQWNATFAHLLEWRRVWQERHGIPLDYELHATKLAGGRGEFPVNRDKAYRAELFHEAIGRIENMPQIKIINALTHDKKEHARLFEWMLNRINANLQKGNAYGVLICDEGNENQLTAIVRRMKKENHIRPDRNVPLDRIIEDPLFKTSKSSYFIQLADLLAFSLLRNEKPLPDGATHHKVASAFNQLDRVLVRQAFKNDPRQKGIIRI